MNLNSPLGWSQTQLYVVTIGLWKLEAKSKSQFMLLIHLINSRSCLERDTVSRIPKMRTMRAAEDFPLSWTESSAVVGYGNKAYNRFVLYPFLSISMKVSCEEIHQNKF